jgi:hypothetical protein
MEGFGLFQHGRVQATCFLMAESSLLLDAAGTVQLDPTGQSSDILLIYMAELRLSPKWISPACFSSQQIPALLDIAESNLFL